MNDSQPSSGPPRKKLAEAAVLTFIGAVVVTVLFIMPAEYGVDPTGIGGKLGLTSLSAAEAPEIATTSRIVSGTFPDIPPEEEFDYYDPEVMGDPFSRTHEAKFRSDKLTVELDVYEQVEIKAMMHQGDALVYTWALDEGNTVYTDFHADPGENDAYPEGYWVRYLESETTNASGSIIAPFDGNHGWYWLNIEEQPIRITLEVHGYYEDLGEIMRSYQ